MTLLVATPELIRKKLNDRMNRLVLAIAVFGGCVSAFLCWKVLGLIPHVPDELSYLYQGRILAAGHLWVQAPEVPEAFIVQWDHILRDGGRWRALYPPGWPILLMIGWLVKMPFLINPILLFLSVIGVYRLASQLFDEKTGLFAVIAFVASPFVLLMSAGFMSHTAALCLSVWCTFFLSRGQGRDFLKAGALGAFAFLIRPFTACALLAPAFLWFSWKTSNRKTAAVQIAVGVVPLLLVFLLYNQLLFGSPIRTGYSYDPDASFRGSLIGLLRQHIPWYFRVLCSSLWGWPWPDLLIFVPLIVPHKGWRTDLLLIFCFLTLLIAYSLFYYADIVYSGPRYVYEAVGFLAILAARSILLVGKKLAPLLLLLFLYPFVGTLPSQMAYHRAAYHGQSHDLIDLVNAKGIGNDALVLISGNPHVFRTFFLENSLIPAESRRVFARDIPGLREKLIKAYPRREVWSMKIELTMLPGRNSYEDRALIRDVKWERLL